MIRFPRATVLMILLSIGAGCSVPRKRYRDLWIGMEQSLVESAYRSKQSKQSAVLFRTRSGQSEPDRYRMPCLTYGHPKSYSETVCFEGGVLAVKAFLRPSWYFLEGVGIPFRGELVASKRVADDRGEPPEQFEEDRLADLYLDGRILETFSFGVADPGPPWRGVPSAWDLTLESTMLKAFDSIEIGVPESRLERLPYFWRFPERIAYYFVPRGGAQEAFPLSRCELHENVSFCVENGTIVAKGITLPSKRVLVVDAAFAAQRGINGSERVSYAESAIDCTTLTSLECRMLSKPIEGLWDILRVE